MGRVALTASFTAEIVAKVDLRKRIFFGFVAAYTGVTRWLTQQAWVITTVNFMAGKATFFQRFMNMFALEGIRLVTFETQIFGTFYQKHFIVRAMGTVASIATAF